MRRFARAGNKDFLNQSRWVCRRWATKTCAADYRKLRSYAKLARETADGVTVVSPASLPFFGSARRGR